MPASIIKKGKRLCRSRAPESLLTAAVLAGNEMKTNVYCDSRAERLMALTFSLSQVLLFGLEQPLATELVRVLAPDSEVLPTAGNPADLSRLLDNERLDIVFCSSKPEFCRPLLAAVKRLPRHIPVVVVSAEPEFAQWLDAMEAGAVDYCAAPFDRSQICFILSSHLPGYELAA